MSDERDGAGSAGAGAGASSETGHLPGYEPEGSADPRGDAAVVTRPLRPTGKRARRSAVRAADGAAEADENDAESKAGASKNGDDGAGGTITKKTKKDSGDSRNPIAFVFNYLKQVVAELRKVIWPNRKQMVTYTSVVLVFLAFMVLMIFGTDQGLARLVTWTFGAG